MINRKKTITGLIAVAMCTSLVNTSITPASEINTNNDTLVNTNSSKEDNLNNSDIVKYAWNSINVENLVNSTTEAAITVGADTSIASDYVTIEQTENGSVTLDESSSNEQTGYLKYKISPDDGYEIEDVIVDGKSIGVYKYYEFENLTETGHTISAVFKEIQKHATGYIPEFVEVPYVYNGNLNTDLPLKFGLDQATKNDLYYNTTDKEFISPVKNQGNLGVCWVFSAIGTLESTLLKEKNLTTPAAATYDFSENNMRYALSSDGGNKLGFNRTNYGGGNFSMALAYLTREQMNGVVNEDDDPYSDSDTTIRTLNDIGGKTVQDYYPTQVIRLGNLNSTATDTEKQSRKAEIKDLIMKYGSVTLSYYSDDSYYRDSNFTDVTEAYYNPDATTGNTNHAVSIVGWDDTYSVNHFNTNNSLPTNNGAFLVKNSWGSNWGQNGYFYISYEDPNAFSGINAFKDIESRDFFNNIYEYDTFGYSADCGYSNDYDQYYANVFNTKKSGLEKLSAISTYCIYPNSYIKLYVSTDGGKTFSEKKADSGYVYDAAKGYKIDEAGYYTFMLNEPIELNCAKFSVAIEVQKASGDTKIIPLEYNTSDTYSSNAVVESGSYIGANLNNLINNITTSSKYSLNTCIKAFTENITVDKSGLQTLYDAYKNYTQGNYTSTTWITFTTALTNAKTVINNANATQIDVDTAITSLNSAINGLTQKASGGSGGGGGGGGGGSSISTVNVPASTGAANTTSSNLSSINNNISQQIANSINGELKDSEILKTDNGNSIVCTNIFSTNSEILKVITIGDLIGTSNNTDTISVKASENEQVYTYIEAINKYLPIASTKEGDTLKINIESNKTYVVTTSSLPVVNVGWNKVDTSWYMINANGSMKTGWLKDTDGNWYNLSDKGNMNTGWLKDTDSNWYFLKSSGAMASNEYVNGYYLGTNGAWIN